MLLIQFFIYFTCFTHLICLVPQNQQFLLFSLLKYPLIIVQTYRIEFISFQNIIINMISLDFWNSHKPLKKSLKQLIIYYHVDVFMILSIPSRNLALLMNAKCVTGKFS